METVTMRRLGSLEPTGSSLGAPDKTIESAPIVLWSGNTPREILYYEDEVLATGLVTLESQRIDRVEGAASLLGRLSLGPFPITFRSAVSFVTGGDLGERIDDLHMTIGDLDGDGKDELILGRRHGSLQVLNADRERFRDGPSGRKGGVFTPRKPHRVRLGGKDSFYCLLAWESNGEDTGQPAPAGGVWRIDNKGIAEVKLRGAGWAPERLVSVGALARPGSSSVDEILLLSQQKGQTDLSLSRHRPDGELIEPPRAIYGNLRLAEEPSSFVFVPGSQQAVFLEVDANRLHIFSPHKPANWMRTVDIPPTKAAVAYAEVLALANPADVRVLVRHSDALYWIDQEGRFYAPPKAPNGPWQELPSGEAYHRIAKPSADHDLVTVLPTGEGLAPLLVVQTREAKIRRLSYDELLEAGARFIPRPMFEELRVHAIPKPEECDRLCHEEMDEEREERGVTEPVKTTEDWARLLPTSYEARRSLLASSLKSTLEVTLATFLPHPVVDQYGLLKNQEFAAWREALRLAPETTVSLLEGTQDNPLATLPASMPKVKRRSIRLPFVSFRLSPTEASLVMALSRTLEPADPPPTGFYAVTIRRGAR